MTIEYHLQAAAPSVNVAQVAAGLRAARLAWREERPDRHAVARFPSLEEVQAAVEQLCAAMFPQRLGGFSGTDDEEDAFVAARLSGGLGTLQAQIDSELAYWQIEATEPFEPDHAANIVRLFADQLPHLRTLIDSDVEAAFLGDPAARSIDEILICYPGAHAILLHRLAHALHSLGAPIVARIVSELANRRTGIDIHPGASIGPSFFIDHGTGVVIGETAIVGARVRLYQHVTLGARSPLGASRVSPRNRFSRHPVVGDDVVIYAGATILGSVTIGSGSTIGGNVWLLDDVPPGSVVAQPTATILYETPARELQETLAGGTA